MGFHDLAATVHVICRYSSPFFFYSVEATLKSTDISSNYTWQLPLNCYDLKEEKKCCFQSTRFKKQI